VAHGLAIEPSPPATAPPHAAEGALATRVERFALRALMLLPGALIGYLGFNAGGFFPTAPAIACLLLAQALLVRVMLARHPFEGLSAASLLAIGGLGVLTLMSLLSMLWSQAPGRALSAFDLCLLYLLALLLLGSVKAGAAQLRLLIYGLLIGASAVILAGLASRVLPDVWHTRPTSSVERLSYPITYWNAFGVLAAFAIVLAFHLTCSLRERRLTRTLAAGVLPLLCVALYLTLSRGPMLAGAAGLALYVLLARPRGLLSGALASVPASAVAVIAAHGAGLLNTAHPTTPAAVAQGHHVALVAGLCALAAAGLRLALAFVADARLRELFGRPLLSSTTRRGATAAAIAIGALALLTLNAPHTIATDWHRFLSEGAEATTRPGQPLSQRLTSISDDHRTALWKVALQGFESAPLIGHGAGSFQTLWEQDRPRFNFTLDAHSLYLQTLSELGIVGLLALLLTIGAILVGVWRRAKGLQRTIYGALLAASVVWALHAGVDWDWQMPAVSIGFFAAGGAALGPLRKNAGGFSPGVPLRLACAGLCLAAMVVPLLMIGSQGHLDAAKSALYAHRCRAAEAEANASIGWLSGRPEPHEVLAYCDLETGRPRQAIVAMQAAVAADPHSWQPYYGLAIARSAIGLDPREAMRRALALNPLEPLTIEAAHAFDTASRRAWIERSPIVGHAALRSKDLSISPS
jgi:hypothetical protein